MATVLKCNGPCQTAEAVDSLLATCDSNKDRLHVVKAQLQYHKIVLQKKSPFLRTTGSLQDITVNLKLFLGADPNTVQAPVVPGPSNRKRRRVSDSETSDSDTLDSCSPPGSESEHDPVPAHHEAFQFTRTGELVAVHYDLDLYVGEVTEVYSSSEASINFMERLATRKDLYHWPSRQDQCRVHSNFVVAGNLTVSPASSSSRSVVLDNMVSVLKKHAAYKQLFQ